MGMNEYLEKMSLNEAIDVATKYAEDIAIFASVDKYAVSKVCEVLLLELQAYKDKEDKLREYVKGLEKDNLKDLSEFEPIYIFESIIFAIKQILNEGSDE